MERNHYEGDLERRVRISTFKCWSYPLQREVTVPKQTGLLGKKHTGRWLSCCHQDPTLNMLVGSLEKTKVLRRPRMIHKMADLKLLFSSDFVVRFSSQLFFFGGVEINVLQVVVSEVLHFFDIFLPPFGKTGVLPTSNYVGGTAESQTLPEDAPIGGAIISSNK